MMMTVTRTIAKSLTLSRQLTLLPQSPIPNRQQLEELDAPLAEGVQPAPEPPVVDRIILSLLRSLRLSRMIMMMTVMHTIAESDVEPELQKEY